MSSRFSMACFVSLALIGSLCFVSVARAQTAANCTFSRFNPPAGFTDGDFFAKGINDYKTVVGVAFTGGEGSSAKGFIRFSGGGMNLFAFPNAFVPEFNKHWSANTTSPVQPASLVPAPMV